MRQDSYIPFRSAAMIVAASGAVISGAMIAVCYPTTWGERAAVVVLVFLPLIAVAVVHLAELRLFEWRQQRRRLANRCTRCEYDLTGNVSGVCPECGLDRLGSVIMLLKAHEDLLWVKAIGSVLLGLVLLPIGPLFVATALWLASWRFGPDVPWFWLFIGLCLLMIPLLFGLELRTQGKYAEGLGGSVGLHPEGVAATPGFLLLPHAAVCVAANSPGLATGLVDFFLAGPRAIVFGLWQLRIARRLQHVSRQHAGEVLVRLTARSGGYGGSAALTGRADTRGLARGARLSCVP